MSHWNITFYNDGEEGRTVRNLTYSQAIVLLKALSKQDVDATAREFEHDGPTGSERHIGDRRYM